MTDRLAGASSLTGRSENGKARGDAGGKAHPSAFTYSISLCSKTGGRGIASCITLERREVMTCRSGS